MRELQITTSFTNREGIAMEAYLNEVARIEMVSPEEEITLARKIRQGDKAALDRLCTANLRFVVSIAKKFLHMAHGMTLTDLISEGNLGLIKAAERFDDTRGFKFISFAVWWIRRSIQAAIHEHSRIVRLPVNKIDEQTLIYHAQLALEQACETEPQLDQLAEHVGMTEEKVAQLLSLAQKASSLDAHREQEEDFTLLEKLPSDLHSDRPLLYEEDLAELQRLLSLLSERERWILEQSFGLNGWNEKNNAEIARDIGLTAEAVRQIRVKALKKLREQARKAGTIVDRSPHIP